MKLNAYFVNYLLYVRSIMCTAYKTEVMWCTSYRGLSQPSSFSVLVAGVDVHPVSSLGEMGVFIYSDLGAATHFRKTVSCCFLLPFVSYAIFVAMSVMTVSVDLRCC